MQYNQHYENMPGKNKPHACQKKANQKSHNKIVKRQLKPLNRLTSIVPFKMSWMLLILSADNASRKYRIIQKTQVWILTTSPSNVTNTYKCITTSGCGEAADGNGLVYSSIQIN